MVGTIMPIVYGHRRLGMRSTVLRAHAAGCAVGSSLIGIVLGVGGTLVPWQNLPVHHSVFVMLATGSISLVYSANEIGFIRIPAAQCRWQVPKGWRHRLAPTKASFLYGIGLGLGVATRIPVATMYAVLVWSLIIAKPALSIIVMFAFGVGRFLPLCLMAWLIETDEDGTRLTNGLHRLTSVIHLINGLALAGVGSFLLAGAFGVEQGNLK